MIDEVHHEVVNNFMFVLYRMDIVLGGWLEIARLIRQYHDRRIK